MKSFLPALVLMLVHGVVLAQDPSRAISLKSVRPMTSAPRPEDANSRCPMSVAQRQIEDCMVEENKAIDRRVEARIQVVVRGAGPGDISDDDLARFRERLEASQRAWVAYRQATCEAELGYFGGAGSATLEYLDCMRKHAQSRLAELDAYEPGPPVGK